MKNKLVLFFLFLLTTAFSVNAQTKNAHPPVYFLDSVRVGLNELKNVDQEQVAILTILKESATDVLGEEGKYGIVYIETKAFAKKRFTRYFKSKSAAYAELLEKIQGDDAVQYILNGKVVTKNYEGDLALIDDQSFKEIKILTKEELINDYKVENKEYGILILSTKVEPSKK